MEEKLLTVKTIPCKKHPGEPKEIVYTNPSVIVLSCGCAYLVLDGIIWAGTTAEIKKDDNST